MSDSRQDDVLALAPGLSADRVGGKAATLAALAAAGFPVPPGFVVTAAGIDLPDEQLRARIDAQLAAWPAQGAGSYAVRSSAVAEDLPDASYAGLYESYLDVPRAELVAAVRRCYTAATSARIADYRAGHAPSVGVSRDADRGSAMAVLVQPMIAAAAAGVAFTANPVTGDRAETVVTAVRGLGERLVSGAAVGDEWIVCGGRVEQRRGTEDAVDADQARAVADLARHVEAHLGVPQDVEWAIDGGAVVLLQARPMTALPHPVDWTPPGPGLWQRNFRLGEWLPEPMTPLFADWLLPGLETGYLAGMRATFGTTVPFRYAAVHGWYYNAAPVPSLQLLARALVDSRGRIVPVLYNALVRVSRDPVAADRAILGQLYRRWRDEQLPSYRRLVAGAETGVDEADVGQLRVVVDQVAHAAGAYLWSLAIVGGSAWKIEGCLARFCHDHHLDAALGGTVQVLLRGLPGLVTDPPAHAVSSLDWSHPTLGEFDAAATARTGTARSDDALAEQRRRAEAACRTALVGSPAHLHRFDDLLEVAQRYATIREEQARDLTLGWPLLRRCAGRLGQHLADAGRIATADDVLFLTRAELESTSRLVETVKRRRATWESQRRLAAPLTLGRPPRLIGDPIARAVTAARGTGTVPACAIVGHPASAGRATGQVRFVAGPADFAAFRAGEVLLAKATAPAWTPLFARATAIITDGGTLAAHASLIAREYGIPAVVGTGDATIRLHTGQRVIVDGTAGTITPLRDG